MTALPLPVSVRIRGDQMAKKQTLRRSMPTAGTRLELHALARGGVAGSRRPTARATLSSLENRGIVEVDGMGVVRWSCKKFGKDCGEECGEKCDKKCGKECGKEFAEFIVRDADRQELAEWQSEGRGGLWRIIWPPVLIGAALMLTFLFLANPEMQSTLLALLGSCRQGSRRCWRCWRFCRLCWRSFAEVGSPGR